MIYPLTKFFIKKENKTPRNGKWIRDPKVDIYLETDVSKAGWGGNLNGKITGGRWSEPVLQIFFFYFLLKKLWLSNLYYRVYLRL